MSFKEEKNDYLDMIRYDSEFLKAMAKDSEYNDGCKMVALDPNNEAELDFAKELYKYLINKKKIENGEMRPISDGDFNLEEFEFVRYIREVIIALKNRDIGSLRELEKEVHSKMNIEDAAKLSFQSCYLSEVYYYELSSFLAEKCGFYIDNMYEDSMAVNQFGIYLVNAFNIFNKQTDYLRLLENYPLSNNHGQLDIVKCFLGGFNYEYDRTMDRVINSFKI